MKVFSIVRFCDVCDSLSVEVFKSVHPNPKLQLRSRLNMFLWIKLWGILEQVDFPGHQLNHLKGKNEIQYIVIN